MLSLASSIAQRFARAYPFYSGCARIANLGAFRKLIPGVGVTETTLRDGSRILVDLSDYVGRAVYLFGELDPKITWVFRRVLRSGDTVLDVGAHCGAMALCCAQLVGPHGSVHAFEPQPHLAALIEKSAAANGWSHVHVHPVALSVEDTQSDLTITEGYSNAASLNPPAWMFGRAMRVSVKRGSPFLGGLHLNSIRLMKIDVEGHEASVLEGAREFLAEHPPSVIVFESYLQEPFFEQAAVKLLGALQYEIFEIPRGMFRPSLRAVTPGPQVVVSAHDFVAVKRDPHAAEIVKALGVG